MSDLAQKVYAETLRFQEKLPELLPQFRDRWVVFRDGMVRSDHPNETEAYAAAVAEFGADGGFVVARVCEVTPTPLTAGVMFGLAHA